MASYAKKLNGEEGLSCSDHGNEISRSDSDRHWRRRKYNDNVVADANHEIVIKTTEPFIDVDMPSPFPGGDEQVSLSFLLILLTRNLLEPFVVSLMIPWLFLPSKNLLRMKILTFLCRRLALIL
jgi:hypothetical protein